VNGQSPVPAMMKYHDRIASLHLKDREGPAAGEPGPNTPWGQGETPLRKVLLTMKKNRYKFPASIEYEYNPRQKGRRDFRSQEVRGVLPRGAGVKRSA